MGWLPGGLPWPRPPSPWPPSVFSSLKNKKSLSDRSRTLQMLSPWRPASTSVRPPPQFDCLTAHTGVIRLFPCCSTTEPGARCSLISGHVDVARRLEAVCLITRSKTDGVSEVREVKGQRSRSRSLFLKFGSLRRFRSK